MNHRIWKLTMLIAIACTTGCKKEPRDAAAPSSASGANPVSAPATGAPVPIGKDGVTYAGPELGGGRGGSYSYTLCPNGGYVRWCLDGNCDRGTYRIEASAIVFVSSVSEPKGKESRLVLSADRKTLGDKDSEGGPYVLAGPADKTDCGG
ncbi:MAG: hypothetical protein H0T42_31690 [Deltaproteobacteria bacterium]|nr:hypothetical protein [Deltaproteobacteria bacterium]